MKKYLFILIFFICLPVLAEAQTVELSNNGLEVSPRIIDEQAMAGDLLKYKIKIKNNTKNKADIYAMVNDVSQNEGEMKFLDPAELDRTTSIARWIKFKRGVIELNSGEEISVPLEINISSDALPGKRFARIAFPIGSNRKVAGENMAKKSYTQLLINIAITENVIEKAQVKNFQTTNNIFLTTPIDFALKLNNFGNKPIIPKGSIFIYNRRGEELVTLDVNKQAERVGVNEIWKKNIAWSDIKGMGKFKAKLELEYGVKDKRDLQDTLFFWYFPWQFLIIFFVSSFLFLVLMIVLIFKRTYYHQTSIEHQTAQRKQNNQDGVLNLKK